LWTTAESFKADINVSHYGESDMLNADLSWSLTSDNGDYNKKGSFSSVDIKQGTVTFAGKIQQSLSAINKASRLKLRIQIDGTSYANEWSVWVYPEKKEVEIPSSILFAKRYDTQVKKVLEEGGTVLLSLPASARTDQYKRILRTGFKPIFWTGLWRQTRHETTMGILCDPSHPALKEFPTDSHSDWQWAQLMNNSRAFVLSELPAGYLPIVQGIDDFHRGRKLGHVFEGCVGKGRIIVCGIDLHTDLDRRPAARQMLYSLISYMNCEHFSPSQELDIDLMFESSLALSDQVIYASSALQIKKADYEKSALDVVQDEIELFSQTEKTGTSREGASAAFDLNWQTDWIFDGSHLPQEVQLDIVRKRRIMGILYKPTKVSASRVTHLDVYVSNDRNQWGIPAGSYSSLHDADIFSIPRWPHNVLFDTVTVGRYMRIVITGGFENSPELRIAEIEPLYVSDNRDFLEEYKAAGL